MYTKLFSPILNKIYPCSIEEVKHSIQKEKRIIDILEPILNQHRLVINTGEVEKDINFIMQNPERNQRYSLSYQLTRITKDRGALKHDDRIDALCIAVDYYVESMDRDSDRAAEEYNSKLLQAEIKKHLENCLGRKLQIEGGFLSTRFSK